MIAIVVGMHRSGTSSVAGLLHQCGAPMGEEAVLLPHPSPENPRGFFENHRFRLINDRIVARSGYRVDSWQTVIPRCAPASSDRLRMRRLLRRYARRYPLWGFKDPRTCLTLDSWLAELERIDVLHRVRVVFVVRDAVAVARSLERRNNLDLASGLALWRNYNERVLAVLDAWRPAVHTVRYEDLCQRPVDTCGT